MKYEKQVYKNSVTFLCKTFLSSDFVIEPQCRSSFWFSSRLRCGWLKNSFRWFFFCLLPASFDEQFVQFVWVATTTKGSSPVHRRRDGKEEQIPRWEFLRAAHHNFLLFRNFFCQECCQTVLFFAELRPQVVGSPIIVIISQIQVADKTGRMVCICVPPNSTTVKCRKWKHFHRHKWPINWLYYWPFAGW